MVDIAVATNGAVDLMSDNRNEAASFGDSAATIALTIATPSRGFEAGLA